VCERERAKIQTFACVCVCVCVCVCSVWSQNRAKSIKHTHKKEKSVTKKEDNEQSGIDLFIAKFQTKRHDSLTTLPRSSTLIAIAKHHDIRNFSYITSIPCYNLKK